MDAAFAFVLTLLVISFDALPKDSSELLLALKGIPAFGASFLLLAQFWYSHNTWCRRYGIDDGRSTVLGLLLVFLVMIFVYPLRVQFASMFAWLSSGWLPSTFRIQSLAELQVVFMVFGGSFAGMSAVMTLLYQHAQKRASAIGLDPLELALTRVLILQWRWNVFVGVLSIFVAATCPANAPVWRATAGGMMFFLLTLTSPWFKWRAARLRTLHAGQEPVFAPTGTARQDPSKT
ncbi:MAG: DUF1211 domain-containing protein [Ahniella sp.]|nr:DUF1211 domain-containing protein [Ahniella sp.]